MRKEINQIDFDKEGIVLRYFESKQEAISRVSSLGLV